MAGRLARGLWGRLPASVRPRARVAAYVWRTSAYLLPVGMVLLAFLVWPVARDFHAQGMWLDEPLAVMSTLGLSLLMQGLLLAVALSLDAVGVLAVALAVPAGLWLAYALGAWLEGDVARGRVQLAVVAFLAFPWALILLAVRSPVFLLLALPAVAFALAVSGGPAPAPAGPRLRYCDACDARLRDQATLCPVCRTPAPAPPAASRKG